MTLPTCSPATRSSSDSSGALVSKPTMSSCPRRCSSLSVSFVDDTQAAEGSWDAVGLADGVPPADDGPFAVDGGLAGEEVGTGGAAEQPARTRATRPDVVTAIRRGVRCRVGEVTARRYVIGQGTSECRLRAARPRSTGGNTPVVRSADG